MKDSRDISTAKGGSESEIGGAFGEEMPRKGKGLQELEDTLEGDQSLIELAGLRTAAGLVFQALAIKLDRARRRMKLLRRIYGDDEPT